MIAFAFCCSSFRLGLFAFVPLGEGLFKGEAPPLEGNNKAKPETCFWGESSTEALAVFGLVFSDAMLCGLVPALGGDF